MTAGIMAGALRTARLGGFCNTIVTTAPQVTSYLVEHSMPAYPDPFTEQLIGAALEVRAAQPDTGGSRHHGRAADRRRAACPETAADQHLPADRGGSLHLAQHGEDPSSVGLPQARGGVALGGDRAGSRPAPALNHGPSGSGPARPQCHTRARPRRRGGADDRSEPGHRGDRQQRVGDLLVGRARSQRPGCAPPHADRWRPGGHRRAQLQQRRGLGRQGRCPGQAQPSPAWSSTNPSSIIASLRSVSWNRTVWLIRPPFAALPPFHLASRRAPSP